MKWWLYSVASFLLLSTCFAQKAPKAQTDSIQGRKDADNLASNQTDAFDLSLFQKAHEQGEKHQFTSHVTRLLGIFAKHMYVYQDAFLRELIANSRDAIQKAKDMILRQTATATPSAESMSQFKVVVKADKEKGVLIVTDNGIGMTRDDMIQLLGTIARSGTAQFDAEKIKKEEDIPSLIGQFGVGFYSVLLVADQVIVISKNDDDPKQWIWENDSSADYRVIEDPRGVTLKRGTQIIIKLKPDAKKYLEESELEKILKKYFNYDSTGVYLVKKVEEEVPIAAEEAEKEKEKEVEKKDDEKEKKAEKKDDVEVEEEEKDSKEKKEEAPKTKKILVEKEVLISQSKVPLWRRNPKEVAPEEYNALYKSITNEYQDPLTYAHVKAESLTAAEFRSVLFIPKRPPFKAFESPKDIGSKGILLHVRGVFVTDDLGEFLPRYLSFVRGVIDSDELPLHVSRDVVQSNEDLKSIQKKIVNKVFEMIDNLSSDEAKFKEFYAAYSQHLKMEVIQNDRYRNKIAKLLRFNTSLEQDKLVSLDEYIKRREEQVKSKESTTEKKEEEDKKAEEKKKEQKKLIYFLAGSNIDEIERSPFVERLKEKNLEVLYLPDTADEHTIQALQEYNGWKFQSIAKEGFKIDEEEDEKIKKSLETEFKPLQEYMAKVLSEVVDKVVLSTRLSKSPCAVVASDYGWTGNMERIIMAQASVKDDPMLNFFSKLKKTFEVNPHNPIIKELLKRVHEKKTDKYTDTFVQALYDSTLIWSGYSVRDLKKFAKNIDKLIRMSLNVELEAEEPEAEKKNTEDHMDELVETVQRKLGDSKEQDSSEKKDDEEIEDDKEKDSKKMDKDGKEKMDKDSKEKMDKDNKEKMDKDSKKMDSNKEKEDL